MRHLEILIFGECTENVMTVIETSSLFDKSGEETPILYETFTTNDK